MHMHLIRQFSALALVSAAAWGQHDWTIDRVHSGAQFSVRHLMVSTVRGQFGKLTGTAKYDPANPTTGSITAEVDASTIDTREPKRDADLKGPDFFDVEKHPTIKFQSTRLEPAGPEKFKMTGNLTMRGVTRTVAWDVEGLGKPVKDPRSGADRIGATATAKIKRSDFGMTWNRVIEAGGVTVGDEVTLIIDVELIRLAPK